MAQIERLLIIPARSGSKRIKNKNIKLFFKKPIIYYPLKTALDSKLFKKIHVSTDSKKILNISKKVGIFSDFLRPKKLSKDNSDLFSVIQFVKDKYENQNITYDEYWCLLPCSPLIDIKDLIKCSKIIKKHDSSVMAISKFPKPINWSLKIKNRIIMPHPKIRDKKISNQQYFYDAGQLYCFTKKFLKQKNFNFKDLIPYVLPYEKSIDVDNNEDWEFMKKLYILKGLNGRN